MLRASVKLQLSQEMRHRKLSLMPDAVVLGSTMSILTPRSVGSSLASQLLCIDASSLMTPLALWRQEETQPAWSLDF